MCLCSIWLACSLLTSAVVLHPLQRLLLELLLLCSQKYDITLVSPRNYFLYTPLLPAVCTGTVEERSIVEPIRRIMAGKVSAQIQHHELTSTVQGGLFKQCSVF